MKSPNPVRGLVPELVPELVHTPDPDAGLLIEQSLRDIVCLLDDLLCADNCSDLSADVLDNRAKLVPCCDSRQLRRSSSAALGQIFVAMTGESFDGHDFILEAVEQGVKAIIYQSPRGAAALRRLRQRGILGLQVRHSRCALSRLSAQCFGQPARRLRVLGVTGTDGKSSIAYLVYQILQGYAQKNIENRPVGLLSTFALDLGRGLEANPAHQTTPESLVVHRSLAQMLANGCEYAVLECSSHGLSPQTARLLDVVFDGAVFSNLSPEHLEFHGTMECYARDKARLFTSLKPTAVAVWNAAERSSELLYAAAAPHLPAGVRHFGYRADSGQLANTEEPPLYEFQAAGLVPIPFAGVFCAENARLQVDSSQFSLSYRPGALQLVAKHLGPKYRCEIGIPGSMYIANVLGALALCCAVLSKKAQDAVSNDMLQKLLQSLADSDSKRLRLRAPKGRMELVSSRAPFAVMIDYAHSPGAFSRLLPELRTLLDNRGTGRRPRMLLVFGSGGQRDRHKRPLQGRIAAAYADMIVLCDEDPRNEPSLTILEEIAAGIPLTFGRGEKLFLIVERLKAIELALSKAEAGDLVLLLGKGHENSIIAAEGPSPWDERAAAREVLARLGY